MTDSPPMDERTSTGLSAFVARGVSTRFQKAAVERELAGIPKISTAQVQIADPDSIFTKVAEPEPRAEQTPASMGSNPTLQQPLRKFIQTRRYTRSKPAFELGALLEMPQDSHALDGRKMKRLKTTHQLQGQHAPSEDELVMSRTPFNETSAVQQVERDMEFRRAGPKIESLKYALLDTERLIEDIEERTQGTERELSEKVNQLRDAKEQCTRLRTDMEVPRAGKDATIAQLQEELSDEKSKNNENKDAKAKLDRIRDQWTGMLAAFGPKIKQELEE